tara:strand:- start:438 stop:665 length:228 start_codon:yes stop_codon:yes gene_type:complete
MSDYDNTNKGAIFTNKYKEEGDNKPDHVGDINVEGKDWRIALWEATSKKGNKYLSARITEPREQENSNNSDDVPF